MTIFYIDYLTTRFHFKMHYFFKSLSLSYMYEKEIQSLYYYWTNYILSRNRNCWYKWVFQPNWKNITRYSFTPKIRKRERCCLIKQTSSSFFIFVYTPYSLFFHTDYLNVHINQIISFIYISFIKNNPKCTAIILLNASHVVNLKTIWFSTIALII